MQSYGPNLNETYKSSTELIKFMDSCTKYVGNLNPIYKFYIWRYTIGSASVNTFLITGKLSNNAVQWAYLTFLYYSNTFSKIKGLERVGFYDPIIFKSFPKAKQEYIAKELITKYIKIMEKIIKDAPKPTGSFHVFKVASPYPGLPTNVNELPASVLQLPFNSTTVTPYFNFAPFLAPTAHCCLFDIEIPKGTSCLFIPQEYHAYPFEMEIILPFGCIFNISKIRTSTLNYVDPTSVNIVQVQEQGKIRQGAVYNLNEYAPCKSGRCIIQSKTFTVYDTVLSNK